MQKQFLADVLGEYIGRSGYSAGQVARLANVPNRSLANWVSGRAKRPRHVADLLRIARVIRLDADEVELMLVSAEIRTTLKTLLATTPITDPLYPLLAPWQQQDAMVNADVFPKQPPPFQAIRDLPYFVGRADEIDLLSKKLCDSDSGLCVIQGMGGVGKSALAARLAYTLRDRFTDGVLWAKVTDSNVMAILYSFAAAFGRDVSNYSDMQTRSQVVRELLTNKRVLLVLDDVVRDDELDYLLPLTTEQCSVIITTRRLDLSSLLGAFWYQLKPFDAEGDEAVALYSSIVGEGRILAEREIYQEMADLLGHLPLALAITAGRLVSDPLFSAESLIAQIQQDKPQVSQLSYGKYDLTKCFDISYDWLTADEQYFFTCLSLFFEEEIFIEAAAAAAQISVAEANRILQKLYRLSLILASYESGYKLHTLVSDYVRQQHSTNDASNRHFIHFIAGFVEKHQWDFSTLAPLLNHILIALAHASRIGEESLYTQLAVALTDYLLQSGQFDLNQTIMQEAMRIATMQQDKFRQAKSQWALGETAVRLGNIEKAEKLLFESHTLIEDHPTTQFHSVIYSSLSSLKTYTSDYKEAQKYLEQGLLIAKSIGDERGICTLLAKLSHIKEILGEVTRAKDLAKQALPIARSLNEPNLLSSVISKLGFIELREGNYQVAELHIRESLDLVLHNNDKERIGGNYSNLGGILIAPGRSHEAIAHLSSGLAIAREINHRPLEYHILSTRLSAYLIVGELAKAERDFALILLAINEQQFTSNLQALIIGGGIAFEKGDFALAEQRFLEVATRIKEEGHIYAQIMLTLGEFYLYRKKLDMASQYTQIGVTKIREIEAIVEEALSLILLGRIKLALGQEESAANHLAQAGIIEKRIIDAEVSCELQMAIAQLKRQEHDADGEEQALKQALTLSEKFGIYRIQAEALYELSRLYVRRREVERGGEFGRKAYHMLHSRGYHMANEVRGWLLENGIDINEAAEKTTDR